MVTKTRCQHRNVTDADVCFCGEPTHECEDCGKCLCNCHPGNQAFHSRMEAQWQAMEAEEE